MTAEELLIKAVAEGSAPAATVVVFGLWLRTQFKMLAGKIEELTRADMAHTRAIDRFRSAKHELERRIDHGQSEREHMDRRLSRVEDRFDMTPVDPIRIERNGR